MAKIKYYFLSFAAGIFGGEKLRYKKLLAGIILLCSVSALNSCKPKIMCYIIPNDDQASGVTDSTSMNPSDSLNPDDIPPRTCYKVSVPDYDSIQKQTSPNESEIKNN